MASSRSAGPAPTRWGRSTRARSWRTARSVGGGALWLADDGAVVRRLGPPGALGEATALRPTLARRATAPPFDGGLLIYTPVEYQGAARRPRPEPQRPPARSRQRARRPPRDRPRRHDRLADRSGRGRRHAPGHRRDHPPGARPAERAGALVVPRRPDQPAPPDRGRRHRALAHRAAGRAPARQAPRPRPAPMPGASSTPSASRTGSRAGSCRWTATTASAAPSCTTARRT